MNIKKGVLIFIIFFFFIFIQNVYAGPYGYGDDMDLKYSVSDGKISYWYGNRMKHTTSLKLWGDVKVKETFKDKQKEIIKSLVNTTHSIHLNILNEFNQGKTWVPVIVGVTSEDVREEVISSLFETEIRFMRRLLRGEDFVGEVTKTGLNKLVNNSDVERINLAEALYPTLFQSVPLINATIVWESGYSGKDQTVCVIDTGVNASHPDLQGKVIAEKCYCRLYEGANPDCCPDGTSEDDNAEDNNGHGTHVAGIIASQNNTYKGERVY